MHLCDINNTNTPFNLKTPKSRDTAEYLSAGIWRVREVILIITCEEASAEHGKVTSRTA